MEKAIEDRSNDLLLYSEQILKHLAHVQFWKGKGTENNPFIIENANILGQTVLIKKSSLFISIMSCNFSYILFEGCQNISLKNCSFKKLVLTKCEKFEIDSCYITDLSFSKVKEHRFKNSIIINISPNRSNKKILFEDCQINDKFLDSILRKIYSRYNSKIKESIPSYIIIFSTFVLYRVFYTYFILNSSDIINILLITGLFFSTLVFIWFFLLYKDRVKKKHPNIIISNNKNN